jgi:hypothetical protein
MAMQCEDCLICCSDVLQCRVTSHNMGSVGWFDDTSTSDSELEVGNNSAV